MKIDLTSTEAQAILDLVLDKIEMVKDEDKDLPFKSGESELLERIADKLRGAK